MKFQLFNIDDVGDIINGIFVFVIGCAIVVILFLLFYGMIVGDPIKREVKKILETVSKEEIVINKDLVKKDSDILKKYSLCLTKCYLNNEFWNISDVCNDCGKFCEDAIGSKVKEMVDIDKFNRFVFAKGYRAYKTYRETDDILLDGIVNSVYRDLVE